MDLSVCWENEHGSLFKGQLDAATGCLKGTYASTTGGTGIYNVLGWLAPGEPDEQNPKPLCLSIYWRSNDGGKSDPSHEVSAMAGYCSYSSETEQQLDLIHIFTETDNTQNTIPLGFFPDKLIFLPSASIFPVQQGGNDGGSGGAADPAVGSWKGLVGSETVVFQIDAVDPQTGSLNGKALVPGGSEYPLVGFTDSFAHTGGLVRQAICFSTYRDSGNVRNYIGYAGYLLPEQGTMAVMQLDVSPVSAKDTWYGIAQDKLLLMRI